MRKLLVAMVGALLLTGGAFAQNNSTALDVAPSGNTWLGLSTGYPLGLTVHYGLGNGLGNGVDLRFNGQFYTGTLNNLSSLGFNLGADALFNIPVDAQNLNVYAGAGPKLGFEVASGSLTTGGSIGGFSLAAQALAGTEYFVSPEIGVFGEFRLGFNYVTGVPGTTIGFLPTLALGANYHF